MLGIVLISSTMVQSPHPCLFACRYSLATTFERLPRGDKLEMFTSHWPLQGLGRVHTCSGREPDSSVPIFRNRHSHCAFYCAQLSTEGEIILGRHLHNIDAHL